MKRSELYAKVWSTPMSRLANDLGISDVGLAKACRRHSVPAPPRGYWAKVAAGQKPAQIALPMPESDDVVHFATHSADNRERRNKQANPVDAVIARDTSSQSRLPVELVVNFDDAHPLVRATQRYCDRIPRLIENAGRRRSDVWAEAKPRDRPPSEDHGRYILIGRECLDITASPASMNWVLRFHATLLRGLTDGGMAVARVEKTDLRFGRNSNGPAIEMRSKEEVFIFRFVEGYRRIRLSPSEVAKRKKESFWASEYETRPSGTFTFSIQGSEYAARKSWQGTQERLQGLLGEILHAALHLPGIQSTLRTERKAQEAEQQRAAMLRAREQQRRDARSEQLKQAFLMLEADTRVQQLEGFLDRLEQRIVGLEQPLAERAAVWVKVVRAELAARNPADEILKRCVSIPSWSTWPPAWWPSDATPSD